MSKSPKVKRPDSKRTSKSKTLSVARREIRVRHSKNGGRF
jgi:hypothetical protein